MLNLIQTWPNPEKFDWVKQFLEEIRFERVGIFTYSHEEGTSAYALDDNISAETKEERAQEIMAVQQEISLEKNQQKVALEFYLKAVEASKNDFTTPRFLMKAGKVALALGNKADALKYFTDIKENYENSPEAATADGLIGLAQ